MAAQTQSEPVDSILHEVSNRFVMFPIRFESIWKMYKKALAVFWTAEEIDLSKDMADWERLNANEQAYLKNILAFFAASDGIVNENLSLRFMNDVKCPEAKAFYGFQIAMENIHCVAADTQILTRDGYQQIKKLAGRTVDVWNGATWAPVTPYCTSDRASLWNVYLSNGALVRCTEKHRWFVFGHSGPVLTQSLTEGMTLQPFSYPSDDWDTPDPDIFTQPYRHGVMCMKTCDPHTLNFRSPLFVPKNYSRSTKIEWLRGLLEGSGAWDDDGVYIEHPCIEFLVDLQLLLTTLGVWADIDRTKLHVHIHTWYIKYMNESYSACIGIPSTTECGDTQPSQDIRVIVVFPNVDVDETYCFEESEQRRGIFNGVLAGNSETYSLLLDTYIKNSAEKYKLLNAINTIPCISKKAQWAMKWIEDTESDFATRLCAFACVEGIFFSGAFCSIFWLKERGVMPGLCLSNEFISRDESLHTEFAILLYSLLTNKCPDDKITAMIKEAVDIEDEFIVNSIPCHMLGMNATLMSQYIRFVADRLAKQLGCSAIFNVTNPFDFMDRIGLENKSNFFEHRNSEYSIANVGQANTAGNYTFTVDEEF